METTTLTKTNKPAHFNAFLEKLVAQFKPLQIYLYAELKKQELCNSIFCNVQAQEQDIYYLLIITEGSTRIENGIQGFAYQHYPESRVMIHAHGKETLKCNISQSNFYFTSVLNSGLLLYSADGKLNLEEVPEPKPERRLAQAQVHWKHRGKMAQGFLAAADRVLEEGHESVTLFLLHQVIEQACIGLIWVFMGYKSDMHNLRRLLYVCGCFSKKPMQHFMGTPENDALLSIIMKSYSEARYRESFSLADKSIYRFVELVESFMELAESMCNEKFDALENQLAEKVEKVSEKNYD